MWYQPKFGTFIPMDGGADRSIGVVKIKRLSRMKPWAVVFVYFQRKLSGILQTGSIHLCRV